MRGDSGPPDCALAPYMLALFEEAVEPLPLPELLPNSLSNLVCCLLSAELDRGRCEDMAGDVDEGEEEYGETPVWLLLLE